MSAEQRCDERRIDISRPVEILDPDVGLGVSGYTQNLSPSGMRARLDVATPPGNSLELAINLADGTPPLETRGEVIWCAPDIGGNGAEIGLKFMSVVDKSPLDLTQLVNRLSPGAPTVYLGQTFILDTGDERMEVVAEEIIQNTSQSPISFQLTLSVLGQNAKSTHKEAKQSDDELLASAEIWKPHPFRDIKNWLQKYAGPAVIVLMALCTPCARFAGKATTKLWMRVPQKLRIPPERFFTRLDMAGRAKQVFRVLRKFRDSRMNNSPSGGNIN